MLYTLPSRYCQSDRLVHMAQDEFGDAPPGWARVQTICEWINRHITYQYGTTDAGTSAYDTAAQRQGVCRDFAHLGISFCRALGIPARYVGGYCLGLDPPDFHAYFQAFIDGRWVSFGRHRAPAPPRPDRHGDWPGRRRLRLEHVLRRRETKSLKVEVREAAP